MKTTSGRRPHRDRRRLPSALRPALALALASALLLTITVRPDAALGGMTATNESLLLIRVLGADRNLRSRVGGTPTVLVVYKAGDSTSEFVARRISRALSSVARRNTVAGMRLKVKIYAFSSASRFEGQLRSNVAAVYVAPGLGSQSSSIASLCRRRSILTITPDKSNVTYGGLSVGLVVQGSKPTILINLSNARREGVRFSPSLLRVAEILR